MTKKNSIVKKSHKIINLGDKKSQTRVKKLQHRFE